MSGDGEYLNEAREKNVEYADSKGLISPLIHIGQFKVDCQKSLTPYQLDLTMEVTKDQEEVAENLGCDLEMVAELEQVCSPANLITSREKSVLNWDDPGMAPTDIGLQTLKHWKDKLKQRSVCKAPRVKARYSEYQCEKQSMLRDIKLKSIEDRITGIESVITIAYYFTRTKRKWRSAAVNIRVLGSQKLTDLKDALPCEFGQQPIGDFTNNPETPKTILAQDVVKSGFFYIENTFYNDCRDEKNVDLSSYIIEWAKNSNYRTEDCKFEKMEDHTFDDLKLRLGTPYLFMHMGECEHILIFKDIRLIHGDDCMSRSEYPIHLSRTMLKSPLCTVCNCYYATWVTRDDELADEDPAYFCDTCFRMLHYDNGRKVANFEAYPYVSVYTLEYPKLKQNSVDDAFVK